MITMTKIDSKNRASARKLLTAWHDSRKVRMMTLSGLTLALSRGINEGFITIEGVNRVLTLKSEQRNDYAEGGHGSRDNGKRQSKEDTGDDSGNEGEDGRDQDEGNGAQSESESKAQGDSSKDGDSDDDMNEQNEDSGSEAAQEKEKEEESHDCETCGADKEAQEYAKQNESIRERCEDCGAYSDVAESGMFYPLEFDTVYKWVQAGVPVALVGPTGSGKSVLAEMIGNACELDNYGCGAMLSKYDLIGYNDAGGTYHGTPLFDSVFKGGLFTFDEMDASAPDATVSFNAITDGQKHFTFPCGSIEKHDSLRIIACLNTYGNGASADYVGRNKLDAATMNRYVKVYIDYDERVELKIAAPSIVKRAQKLRAACTALGIRHIVSTRTVALAQKGRDAGQSNAILDRDLFFAGLDDDTIQQLKNAMENQS